MTQLTTTVATLYVHTHQIMHALSIQRGYPDNLVQQNYIKGVIDGEHGITLFNLQFHHCCMCRNHQNLNHIHSHSLIQCQYPVQLRGGL